MAKFEPNKPIVTREPSIIVDAGLPPGDYTFQLIVQDSDGQRSEADVQVVRVVERLIIRRDIEDEPATTSLESATSAEPTEPVAPPVRKRSRKPK